MTLKNCIVRFKKDKAKRRWKIREAVSMNDVYSAYVGAASSGSIGQKISQHEYDSNARRIGKTEVLADIIQVNSDNTEARPYEKSY